MVFGAIVVVGNVVDEPGLTRVVVVLMTVGSDDVEEVVLGTNVVVVVKGDGNDGSLSLVVGGVAATVVVAGRVVEGVRGSITVVVGNETVVVGANVVVVGMVVEDDDEVVGGMVVVSDRTSVVDTVRVVVGQCW